MRRFSQENDSQLSGPYGQNRRSKDRRLQLHGMGRLRKREGFSVHGKSWDVRHVPPWCVPKEYMWTSRSQWFFEGHHSCRSLQEDVRYVCDMPSCDLQHVRASGARRRIHQKVVSLLMEEFHSLPCWPEKEPFSQLSVGRQCGQNKQTCWA